MRLALLLAAAPLLAQSNLGSLHVTITEKDTGKVTPAIVCITSSVDNSWRVPPDGTIVSPPGVTSAQQVAGWNSGPGVWTPGDTGPVRYTMNVPIKGILESERHDTYPIYDGLPGVSYWNEPVGYFVSGPFTITLPPGKWRLAISHGVEYVPVYEEITIGPQQKVDRNIALTRWVDMPRQGWWSGDPEFHQWRLYPWQNDFILTWAQAADVHMITVPSYSRRPHQVGHPQIGYGKEFQYRKGNYALASGHEGPRSGGMDEQGHLMQMNINSIVRFDDRDHLMDEVCDGVHGQGGLCGYFHIGWGETFRTRQHPEQEFHTTWDSSINTIRNKVDFFEILQYRQLGVDNYYDFLNLGIKLTALAASDVTGGEMLGESLTYAYTGTDFSPDAWYAAVKRGRTFVTNGPMLMLEINGAMPGDELKLTKNATVHIRARVFSPVEIASALNLEVVSHGKVIKRIDSRNAAQTELKAEFDLPIAESQWIAARATSYNDAKAHTTPVYLTVDGVPFADRSQISQIAAKHLKILDWIIAKRIQNPQYIAQNHLSKGDIAHLLETIEDARARYQSLMAAARKP